LRSTPAPTASGTKGSYEPRLAVRCWPPRWSRCGHRSSDHRPGHGWSARHGSGRASAARRPAAGGRADTAPAALASPAQARPSRCANGARRSAHNRSACATSDWPSSSRTSADRSAPPPAPVPTTRATVAGWAAPLVEKRVAQRARRILRRPRRSYSDVGHPAALGLLPAVEPDAPGLAGLPGGDLHLAGHPRRIRSGATDQPPAAAVRHGRRQRTPGRAAHGCERDGVLQREEPGERGAQRHELIITRPGASPARRTPLQP